MAKKKKNNRLIFILIALIALLIAGAVWKSRQKPKGEKVEVEKVKKRTIKETVAASGKVFPEIEVNISPDVSGEVVELYVEEGDSVRVGQLLAKIDPEAIQSQVERQAASVSNSQAQVARAKADIERNKALLTQSQAQKEQIVAQLKNTRSIHERNDKLYKEGIISIQDFDQSLSNLQNLEASLKSADASYQSAKANLKAAEQTTKAAEFTVKSSQASLKELRTNLKRTTVVSPMTGVVSMLNVEKGERVVGAGMMAGTEMMRVANMNTMEVQVDVSENDIPRVTLNDEVEVEVDAYIDRKFKGKVTEIANSATSATGAAASLNSDQVTNFVVKIRVDLDSYQDLTTTSNRFPLRPGMSASVEIFTNKKEEVLSIPIQAVTVRESEEENEEGEKDNLEVVFATVASADTVKMVTVKTGIQDDTYIELLEGLAEGDEIVTGPYSAVSKKLESGMTINKKKDDEDKVNKAEAN